MLKFSVHRMESSITGFLGYRIGVFGDYLYLHKDQIKHRGLVEQNALPLGPVIGEIIRFEPLLMDEQELTLEEATIVSNKESYKVPMEFVRKYDGQLKPMTGFGADHLAIRGIPEHIMYRALNSNRDMTETHDVMRRTIERAVRRWQRENCGEGNEDIHKLLEAQEAARKEGHTVGSFNWAEAVLDHMGSQK
jgi:hypothetical protein